MTRSPSLLTDLARLGRVAAPGRLAPAVLAELGLDYWYCQLDSVLGPVFVAYGPRGLARVQLADESQFLAELEAELGVRARRVQDPGEDSRRRLERALRGDARVPLDLSRLTSFERAVLQKALEIPRGEVRTYGWVAREIGRPAAVRAVGSALATNPVPLAIPCHRVVRSDGRIGEYGCGGPAAKRLVLAEEGADPDRLESLAKAGVRFVGSDTTHVFCVPSCHGARRITPGHEVRFRTAAQAEAAGYRPCRSCRPAVLAA